MPMVRNWRSQYGLHAGKAAEPPVLPGKPNRFQQLLSMWEVLVPNRQRAVAQRYRDQSTSGQIPATRDTYQTKLQSQWSAGLRSDDVFPTGAWSTLLRWPWPVGTPTGQPKSFTGRDRPPVNHGINGSDYDPVWMPRPSPTKPIYSKTDRKSQDWRPPQGAASLQFGPVPWRVPAPRKSGLSLNAGIAQQATQQWYMGVASVHNASGQLILPPPAQGTVTRGFRSISGVLGRVQGGATQRVPAIYTPTQVR